MASTDISSIWDEPATISSSRAPTTTDEGEASAPTPRRSTLFLDSDSEGEGAPKPSATYASKQPSNAQPDIDALFADLDDPAADPDADFAELAPSLDLDALRRAAEAKHAKELASQYPVLPSSSPPRGGDADGGRGKGAGKDGKDGEKAKRKALPKMDEARLLGPDGFPALVKQAKNFKPRGKGHEVSDLNRLLQLYQFWSHKMYPKTQFRDTVQRVEKLCHSKRMQVALSVWRDEINGVINGRSREEVINLTSDAESDNDGGDHQRASSKPEDAADIPNESEGPSSSLPPSRPPSSSSNNDDFPEDFDIDALLREEEEAQAQARTSTSTSQPAAKPPTSGTEEDDALWDELMEELPDALHAPSAPHVPPPPPPFSAPQSAVDDEDEEMWDIVREIEQSSAATDGQNTTTTSTNGNPPLQEAAPQGKLGTHEAPKATNDEGWDEMYL